MYIAGLPTTPHSHHVQGSSQGQLAYKRQEAIAGPIRTGDKTRETQSWSHFIYPLDLGLAIFRGKYLPTVLAFSRGHCRKRAVTMSLAKVASHRGRNVAYLPRLQLVLSLEYEVEPHGYMRWDAMKAEVDHYAGGQNDEFYCPLTPPYPQNSFYPIVNV